MRYVMVLLLLLVIGCNGTSPVAPAPPPEPFDFSGRWAGTLTLSGGGCWVAGTCDTGQWGLIINLEADNFVWKENCPFACARFNVRRSGSFTTTDTSADVRFTAPDTGTAVLLPAGPDCLAGTLTIPGKTGTVRVCR